MNILRSFPFLVSTCLAIAISANAQKKSSLSIGFYNVENLYDTKDDPGVDDAEFLPDSKNQWTQERYKKKLENLSQVIDSMGNGPSILGLCEVENREVLEDLIKTDRLKAKEYGIVHENSPDRRGIDVALIYKKSDFKPIYHQIVRLVKEDEPNFLTRDILLVKGSLNNVPVYFMVNHWPSRRGGEGVSVPKRVFAAKTARMVMDTILAKNAQSAIVLMGDFNDEPIDSSIAKVLGASPILESEKPYCFNLMGPLKAGGDGSHYYNNTPHMLDQIIVTPTLLKENTPMRVKKGSASVYRPIWMQESNPKYKGNPLRTYVGAKYLGGYSDHFPVYCIMDF